MTKRRDTIPTVQEKRERSSSLIRFAATQLALAGWLVITLPTTAATIPSSYTNRFRSCTGRLVSVGVSSDAAARACSGSLSPTELSKCVAKINNQAGIAADDALASCRQVRRPGELANCVIGISSNQEQVTDVLNYCGRSLLPERFAECVVGLRREIEIPATQAMVNCIAATDQLPPSDVSPTFVPQSGSPPIQSTPSLSGPQNPTTPEQINPAPSGSQNQQTTPGPLNTAPTEQNQTTPGQANPTPATP